MGREFPHRGPGDSHSVGQSTARNEGRDAVVPTLAEVVALAFGLAASSRFPVLLMGVFSKRMNREGAIAGMLAGLTATVLYIFVFKGMFFIPGTNLFPDEAGYWFLGIQPESFGAIGAAINFIVAFLVSRVTPAPPAEIRDMIEDIRVPGALRQA